MILRTAAILVLFTPTLLAQPNIPATPRHPVTDTYHGVSVTDDYRWLEDFNDPAVKQWAAAENAAARKYLDAIPARAAVYKQLLALDAQNGISYGDLIARHGDAKAARIFALKFDPAQQHPQLVTLNSLDDHASEHVLVDPDQLDPRHLTEIDFYAPSLDGRYVAVSLSTGGSESGDVKVFDSATGRPLPDLVPRVNGGTAGGSVAWNADSSGFYYTRYPRAGERPAADMDFYQQIWFHQLGATADTYSLGRDFPRIAEIVLESSPDGQAILATVAIGDGGDHEHWLLTTGSAWTRIARVSDQVTQLSFGFDHTLYAISRSGAPRGKVLRFAYNQPLSAATTLVPESEVVIERILPLRTGLCVLDLIGGPSALRYFPAAGINHPVVNVPIPPISSVGAIARLADDSIAFSRGDYLTPTNWYRFDPATGRVLPTNLNRSAPAGVSRYEVVRDFAISPDGTKVPINIIRAKGIALDGAHPALLTGYGGYNISMPPRFSRLNLVLLDRGFVLAEANLRGGGEYGDTWHDHGRLTQKQNVFDDFAACAHYLIDRRYTQPARLGILGGSNGGLLMGAAFTQHPDLFRAVVSEVGIYDMLRVELSPNGAFNVTEFGTVKEQDQFRALFAYSPYHQVKDNTQYPAILFLTGDNDPRVDPMNSRKMTARLQATGTRLPVLLRTSGNSGHGIGTARSEALAQAADIYSFLIQELTGAERPSEK